MPCYDAEGAYFRELADIKLDALSKNKGHQGALDQMAAYIYDLKKSINNSVKRQDQLARVACEFGRYIYKLNVTPNPFSNEAISFMVEHMKLDAKRGDYWKGPEVKDEVV